MSRGTRLPIVRWCRWDSKLSAFSFQIIQIAGANITLPMCEI
jgi:hypothetical protein